MTTAARATAQCARRCVEFVLRHQRSDTSAIEDAYAYGIATGLAEAVALLLLPDETPMHPSYTSAVLTWASGQADVELSPAALRALRRALSEAVHANPERVRY